MSVSPCHFASDRLRLASVVAAGGAWPEPEACSYLAAPSHLLGLDFGSFSIWLEEGLSLPACVTRPWQPLPRMLPAHGYWPMPGSLDTLRSIAEPSWQAGWDAWPASLPRLVWDTEPIAVAKTEVIAELARAYGTAPPLLGLFSANGATLPDFIHPPTDVEIRFSTPAMPQGRWTGCLRRLGLEWPQCGSPTP